jgi:AbrB family looped-hinge helix DNA binding protein
MTERAPGTKLAERMLTQPAGATMAEIIAAAGGPQYNLLKKLEARGYSISKVKEGKETRYFAEPPARQSFEVTMTSKGQVTIPQEIRNRLRLRRGQKLQFTVEDRNRIAITPVFTRLSDLAGILPAPKRTVTLEEMDEAIRNSAAGRFLRAVGRKR